MTDFMIGDVARLSVEISNVDGALADPTTISIYIKSPSAAGVTFTNVTKDAVGKYHFDLPLDSAGSYGYRWQSSGENQGISEGGLYVYPQRVV